MRAGAGSATASRPNCLHIAALFREHERNWDRSRAPVSTPARADLSAVHRASAGACEINLFL